jgi:dTDP-4-dehydrorhamnose 3,5-epimerase
MNVAKLSIPDLLLLTPQKHGDSRGFFSETFRADVLADYGVTTPFIQDNHVRSTRKGVLRGLHFQLEPRAQGKLVRCTMGAILDVAVDIRVGSPTYGQHVAVELSSDNWRQLWVPPGFAHGYVTLEDLCEVIYKVTDYYAPDCDRGLAWNDAALGIDWRLPATDIILSDKDTKQPELADLPMSFEYSGKVQ